METMMMLLLAAVVMGPARAGGDLEALATANRAALDSVRRGRLEVHVYKEGQSPAPRLRALIERAAEAASAEGKVTLRWEGIGRRIRETVLERGQAGARRRLVLQETSVWSHRLPVFTVLIVSFERERPGGTGRWVVDERGIYSSGDPVGFMAEWSWWERELGLGRLVPLEAR